VPVAKVNGTQVNGSDKIIAELLNQPSVVSNLQQTRWISVPSMSAERFLDSESAKKWTKFADDELAALLYPNICRTLTDSYQAFEYVKAVPTFSTMQKHMIRSLGSIATYLAASQIKSKLSFVEDYFCTIEKLRNDICLRLWHLVPTSLVRYVWINRCNVVHIMFSLCCLPVNSLSQRSEE